ncbi:MAG: RtcB family protein [Sedimentisphaerales bacterium]|nr:RtcB family protein [Sedimentisphaerales bacterium]
MQLKRLDKYRCLIEPDPAMRVPACVYVSDRLKVEPDALRQLRDAACLEPARQVLATPDIHVGFGVPIGAVVALQDAIMPAAVGYDINCGMRLLTTPLKRKDCDVDRLAHSIARDIPLGEGKSNLTLTGDDLDAVLTNGLDALPALAEHNAHRAWQAYDPQQWTIDRKAVERNGALPGEASSVPFKAREKGGAQLGTLGGGNHFIEIQIVDKVLDEPLARTFGLEIGNITVMIHSGSRRLGYEVADEYMRLAADTRDAQGPARQLAYLNKNEKGFARYVGAMNAAGNFAYVNRHIMMLLVRRCFRHEFPHLEMPLIYDVSHNMAQFEQHSQGSFWVHRKGATRAFGPKRMAGTPFAAIGQPVIIPGSMGTGSYLLIGDDGSEEALASVNHGAGRTMSRSAAVGKRNRRTGKVIRPAAITDDEFKRSMKDVTLIAADKFAVKEEAPAAYKDIDQVIDVVAGAGLARPVVRLKPLAVLKG